MGILGIEHMFQVVAVEQDSEFLTVKQAAKYLSISEPVLRLTIRCGKIPSSRQRGRRQPVVRKADIMPFLYPLLEQQGGRD
ncbi:MAG: helix-turn-helix domain-containing protein [Chloroflexota bacterium]